MIVTNSSIHYVQARQGLPLGVLVVGWATLGKTYTSPLLQSLTITSGLSGHTQPPRSIPQQPLHPPSRSDVPAIRTNIHHPHHLLRRPLLRRLLSMPVQLDAPGAPSVPAHLEHPHRGAPAARILFPSRHRRRRPSSAPSAQYHVSLPHSLRRTHRTFLLLFYPVRILQRLQHRLSLLLLARRRVPPDPRVRSF